jgi:FKBP-type peptidyl-prolyl cis-trans isomerase (trigger factor)
LKHEAAQGRRFLKPLQKRKWEDEKDEYHEIAVRRVRLGLLLSEIGQANKVEVSASRK